MNKIKAGLFSTRRRVAFILSAPEHILVATQETGPYYVKHYILGFPPVFGEEPEK